MKTIAALLLLTVSMAHAQTTLPFGIPLTVTTDELIQWGGTEHIDELDGFPRWTFNRPPQLDPNFDQFLIKVGPDGEVCRLYVTGRPFETTPDGQTLLTRYQALKSQMTALYGPSQGIDTLEIGPRWNGTSDWVQAISTEQQRLLSDWKSTPTPGNTMPPELYVARLLTRATSTTNAWLELTYIPSALTACTPAPLKDHQ